MSSLKTFSVLFLVVVLSLLSSPGALVSAEPAPPPKTDDESGYLPVEEGELDKDEVDVTERRDSKVETLDADVTGERIDENVDAAQGKVETVKTDDDDENKMVADSKMSLTTTSSKFACGRTCFCSGRTYTRCYRYRSAIWHVRYIAYSGFSWRCRGKVYYSGSRICIRPYCCACAIYLRS